MYLDKNIKMADYYFKAMIGRHTIHLQEKSIFHKLSSFSSILFFLLMADAMLAFWIPNFLAETLGSSFLMGLVMSFSSLVGLMSDVYFPQVLKNYSVRKLLFSSVFVMFVFIAILAFALKNPALIILLIAVSVWGIYYEYSRFASQQFVAESVPVKLRSGGWAIIDSFKNLACFIGPLTAGLLLYRGEWSLLGAAAILVAVSLIILLSSNKQHQRLVVNEDNGVSALRELSHWKVLAKSIWPIIILSFLMGVIDSMFWTSGVTWSESLSSDSYFASLILPAYELPSLFVGMMLAKHKIFEGKKKLAEIFLFLNGLSLCVLFFELPIFVIPFIIFISSIFLSLVYPLTEAVYTDVTARMGIEKKHMVGLSLSTISVAYIVGPILSGIMSDNFGERRGFVIFGVFIAFVSIVLLITTPKKLKLPQSEIAKWED